MNNSQVSSETIISLSELNVDENIFKFYKNEVINKIKENAYIENVEIERKIPNVVEINVEERVPKYSVDYMGLERSYAQRPVCNDASWTREEWYSMGRIP